MLGCYNTEGLGLTYLALRYKLLLKYAFQIKMVDVTSKFFSCYVFMLLTDCVEILYLQYNSIITAILTLWFQASVIFVSYFLYAMNSCINPLVYAATIPAFKALVKSKFKSLSAMLRCNPSSIEGHGTEQELNALK